MDRFVTKSADSISPEGKGPSRSPEDSLRVAHANVRRRVPTLDCKEASKEIHDCVVYVTVLLLLHGGQDFTLVIKKTMQ